ncbi:extensin-like [Diospyros lotus]|uniref:extensin-like n=1 Tax=Diospyros lotus TaxID=55363 RepID=UPI002252DEAE|nr:extensin-like [Diospyros lotus]
MPHTLCLLNILFPFAYECHILILQTKNLCFFSISPPSLQTMVPELENPRVTVIEVRMDCNGCVQKIKKALHGINGIYDINIDFPQQKLTIIGWADPEKIVKAIRKTRKTATICSHTEPSDPSAQSTEPAPDQPTGQPPAPDAANPPPAEAPPAEAAPPAEPPKDQPPNEDPPPDVPLSTVPKETSAGQPAQASKPTGAEEVHVIYHHPPDHGHRYPYGHSYGHIYGGPWNTYPSGPRSRQELGFQQGPSTPAQVTQQGPSTPVHVTHSYSTYKPAPYVTHSYNAYKPSPYVAEYEYVRSPPRHTHYSRPECYSDNYHSSSNGNGNITSMFSDENPNSCRIV